MQTVILDYENARILIWDHKDSINIEEMEEKIYHIFGLKKTAVEWMTSDNLEYKYISD